MKKKTCNSSSPASSVTRLCFVFAGLGWLLVTPAGGFDILIDYRFDSNGFFAAEPQAAVALQAAAGRWSEVITSTLLPVANLYEGDPWRLQFVHPGTGQGDFEISTAAGPGSDPVAGIPPDLYDPGFGIGADTWLLFAGGRSLSGIYASGGAGTGGINLSSVFDNADSPLYREWRGSDDADYAFGDLSVWGGSITFDSDGSTDWFFDVTTVNADPGKLDFYSVALHEIGHALGLSLFGGPREWNDLTSGTTYIGAHAIAVFNADNGTSVSLLDLEGLGDDHWDDNGQRSFPFSNGSLPAPDVDPGILQDLLMDPDFNFVFPGGPARMDLTNVDAAAARDMGYGIIPESNAVSFLAWSALALLLHSRRRADVCS